MGKKLFIPFLILALVFGFGLTLAGQTTIKKGVSNVGSGFLQLGGTTSLFPALKRVTTQIRCRLADDSADCAWAGGGMAIGTTTLIAATAPTISSGFGSGPSIVNSNGPAAFTLNVGTGGVATSGVIGLPTATTGWFCNVVDRTNNTVTRETATTTTAATVTAAAAWAASDILQVSCFAY